MCIDASELGANNLNLEGFLGVLWALWLVAYSLAPNSVHAEEPGIVVTRIAPPKGRAWLERDLSPLQTLQRIGVEDVLCTDSSTWVQLLFLPSSQVWIGPDSRIAIAAYAPHASPQTSTLRVLTGWLRLTVGHLGLGRQEFLIDAESVLAAPRGTDIAVTRSPLGEVIVSVTAGEAMVKNRAGNTQRVAAGQRILVDGAGQMTLRPIVIEPRTTAKKRPARPTYGEGVRLDPPESATTSEALESARSNRLPEHSLAAPPQMRAPTYTIPITLGK